MYKILFISDSGISHIEHSHLDSPALMSIINSMESPSGGGTSSNTSFQQDMNEKMAINAIQRSLMQCETTVKSPNATTVINCLLYVIVKGFIVFT